MSDSTGDKRLALVERLSEVAPTLGAILRENLEFYEEPLIHLLMSEVAIWALGVADGTDQQLRELRAVLSILEEAFQQGSPDDLIPEAIAVSFLDEIPNLSSSQNLVRVISTFPTLERYLEFDAW